MTIDVSSSVVDQFVVFLVISPLMCWLLFVNVAHSYLSSRVDVALLLVRVASCLTLSLVLTVLLTEWTSRRSMLALATLAYASLELVYSWMLPLWTWYVTEVRTKGLVHVLPHSTQKLLLETSLLEWLTDTRLSDKLVPFLPFLLPLTRAEQMKLMEQMPPASQMLLTKPGLLPLLPTSMQKVLLPIEAEESMNHENEARTRDAIESMVEVDETTKELPLLTTEEKQARTSSNAGFDFHQPHVVGTISSENVLNEIVSSRVWNACKALVKVPTARALNRTVGVSSALVVLQLYASRGSRRVFVNFVQFVAVAALSSVACGAIFVRLIQLLGSHWTSVRTQLVLSYVRRYVVRHSKAGIPQLLNQSAPGRLATLRATASSVSVLVVAFCVLRKLRR
ncbi:hypothetical protein PsorP6_009464 [Peronosclerospora sorghi]|uniref:Uncharacterized protein n=1 Tax=Peronosclerospora sorghi TaxID=230839 RepID=A0ACC0W014_9STRA|nr:hypothetical protein PsorP6_009464 [Peronosclerospora sorghi]